MNRIQRQIRWIGMRETVLLLIGAAAIIAVAIYVAIDEGKYQQSDAFKTRARYPGDWYH